MNTTSPYPGPIVTSGCCWLAQAATAYRTPTNSMINPIETFFIDILLSGGNPQLQRLPFRLSLAQAIRMSSLCMVLSLQLRSSRERPNFFQKKAALLMAALRMQPIGRNKRPHKFLNPFVTNGIPQIWESETRVGSLEEEGHLRACSGL